MPGLIQAVGQESTVTLQFRLVVSQIPATPLHENPRRLSTVSGALLATLLLACALLALHSSPSRADDWQYSGFLGANENYQKLEEVKLDSGEKAMRWISPGLILENYKRALVEPVVFYPEPQPGPQVSAETLRQIKEYLTDNLRRRVGEVVQISEAPGTDVARIEPAITGVVVETQGMQAYEVLPVAAVFGGVKAAAGKRKQDVKVFIEVRITDSESGELLGTIVRTAEGKPLKGKKDELEIKDLEENLDTMTDDASAWIADSIGS